MKKTIALLVLSLVSNTLFTGCSKTYNVPASPLIATPTPTFTPNSGGITAISYVYLTQFASPGSGNGQLSDAHAIAADSLGNIYIADTDNHRIQKFDSNGNYLSQWGTFGSGPGQFGSVVGVCLDSSNNVYTCDNDDQNIQKFTSSGTPLTQWNCGTATTSAVPGAVAADPSGNVFVVENSSQTIQKFSNTGTLLTSWSTQGPWDFDSSDPDGITCDSAGNVYTPDYDNSCVYKYSNSGTYLCTIGNYSYCGTLSCGLCVDAQGRCYIADYSDSRIDEFFNNGAFLCYWGNTGANALGNIDYLTLSPSGKIYVADNDTVKVFIP